MAEIERKMFCENCGSSCRMIWDSDEVNYDPENCPFCGEVVGTLTDEYLELYGKEDEEDDNDDSGD